MIASLLLLAAPLSVLLISAAEHDEIFDANVGLWIARSTNESDKGKASGYAENMGRAVMLARDESGTSRGGVAQEIEDAYQDALPGVAFRLPPEFSPTGTAQTLGIVDADGSPEEEQLVAALQQFRDECLTELNRPGPRAGFPLREPAGLAAARERVVAAAEAWGRSENMSSQRDADEEIRQIRQERGWQKIHTAAALALSGLLALRTARSLARRRRAA
ncbi:hypothetical protein GCM10010435_90150 [Winogradskya consettensis]|uniref:Secreted protein n=1 Tax=Winogradskya consettensis TaxID=113560 RepID=A0A919SSY5_9ACTN|nr:hypothetical protein Aco04nite_57040 [Actinoplanes consettensis]